MRPARPPRTWRWRPARAAGPAGAGSPGAGRSPRRAARALRASQLSPAVIAATRIPNATQASGAWWVPTKMNQTPRPMSPSSGWLNSSSGCSPGVACTLTRGWAGARPGRPCSSAVRVQAGRNRTRPGGNRLRPGRDRSRAPSRAGPGQGRSPGRRGSPGTGGLLGGGARLAAPPAVSRTSPAAAVSDPQDQRRDRHRDLPPRHRVQRRNRRDRSSG